VPNLYVLHQNYPNPFNPVTKIKFDIPKSAYSVIKIYDNLGREVSTLVSGGLKAGKYEVEWNAANYPSGVYYYKITSGDFTDSKKMVLVK
jgi:flagellar hook assembly protein FlgD